MGHLACLRLINKRIFSQLYTLERNSFPFPNQQINYFNVKCYSAHKGGNHKPNTLEKYLLVWMKKYPSVSAVPSTISNDEMEKTRNWARIKLNIIMVVLTGVLCIVMVYSGKQAAKRGETLQKMNEKWHEEQNAKK